MCLGETEVTSAWSGVEPWGEVEPFSESELMYYFDTKPLLNCRAPPRLQGGPDPYTRLQKAKERSRKCSASCQEQEGFSRPQYSPRCYQTGLRTIRILQGKCHSSKSAENLSKIDSADSQMKQSRNQVVDGTFDGPAVPFSDSLWSVLLMHPACVRFLERLTASVESKYSALVDQSQVDGINDPYQAPESRPRVVLVEDRQPLQDRVVGATSLPNELLPGQTQALSPSIEKFSAISESSEVATDALERPDSPEGNSNTVNMPALADARFGQIWIPGEVVSSDNSDQLTDAPRGKNSTKNLDDMTREFEASQKQNSPIESEPAAAVEPEPVSFLSTSDGTGNSIQFVDTMSNVPTFKAQERSEEQGIDGSGASGSSGNEELSEDTESSLRRMGVFGAALACAVISIFDPLRANFVESYPVNKSSASPPFASLSSSQDGSRKGNSNTRGQGSDSQNAGTSSNGGSLRGGGGIASGGGGGGGSGGGGGGSDGDDNWGKLPDEPSDGFGVRDARGITIAVAAISLIGATLIHFFRRGKPDRQEVVATSEEQEEEKMSEPEEVVQNEMRGSSNTSIEIAEPLHDLREKQVALCVTPVVHEQTLPVHGDPTSCTVVSPSSSVHNEPEPIELEEVDVKHCTSRGISLAQIVPRSSEVDDGDEEEEDLTMKTHISKEIHVPGSGLESSEQASQNEDLKAENAELLATVSNLMEKLRRADARRKDAANELVHRRASFSTSEADLKGRLLGQEEQNTQIQRRFSEVDRERLSLVSTVKDAQDALSAVHPRLSQTLDEIERLSKVMRDQKKELSRLKLELGNATHDQGVVYRKMQNKEWEMEEINNLIVTMEKIETSVSGGESKEGSEYILTEISAGMKALRELEKRSKATRQIANSFQGLLLKLRDIVFNRSTGDEQSEKTVTMLKAVADEKKQLQEELDEMQKKSRDLVTERDVLQTTVQMLKSSFQEKTLILEEIKLKQDSSEAIISRGEAERKRLMTELEETRTELREALTTIDEAQKYSDEVNAQAEELKEEKRTLQTQLKGLRLRIEQFEVEAQRLHSESEGLRTSLTQETARREELDAVSQELRQSHAQVVDGHKKQVESLQEGLIAAEVRITELREEQANIEEAKKELRDAYDIETQDLKSQIQHLQDQAAEVALQNAQVSGAEELNRIMESAKEKGLKVETGASATSYTSYTRPHAHEHPVPDPMDRNDSMVLAWMEHAAADHPNPGKTSPMEGGMKQVDSALMTGTTEEIIPQKHPPRERRASWPQDMSTMISDHMFGAAQEVVQLTGASLEISREKEAVASNLKEAKTKITETVAKLEEKDAAMCDLTEHFLQVYQIASNLATENDSAVLEIKEAKVLSENLRVQIHQKDERICELEGYFNSRLLAHRVEMDAEQERNGEFVDSMATPRSVTSVGARSRSALPRAPSRTMSTISRVPSHDPVSARDTHRRANSPTPTSFSHIPEAPSSDASCRNMTRQSDSFEQTTSLSELLPVEPESRDTPVVQARAATGYAKSRTSLKRISSAASIKNRSGTFQ